MLVFNKSMKNIRWGGLDKIMTNNLNSAKTLFRNAQCQRKAHMCGAGAEGIKEREQEQD
jgi:hypothetical protein